jgi:hypothetical protein
MKPQMKSASPTPRESTPMNPEDILTPDQLAERLRVKVTWVYEKNRRRGQYSGDPMPCLRLGRYLRFYWPDICTWLRNQGNNHRR